MASASLFRQLYTISLLPILTQSLSCIGSSPSVLQNEEPSKMSLRLAITTEDGNVISVTVAPNESIENVKAILEVETTIPILEQKLFKNNIELLSSSNLIASGVADGDLLILRRQLPQQRLNLGIPTLDDAQQLVQATREHPELLQKLQNDNPSLYQAIVSNNLQAIQATLFQETLKQRQFLAQIDSDPFSEQAQRFIEERISQGNMDRNLENAMEYTPEVFANVVMLYIDCEVNGIPMKAFVDTGAQSTIMTVKCAEECNIMRLCNRQFQGVAIGVGSTKIVGKVLLAQLKIGKSFFPSSFTILEGEGHDMILGLDMLKKHQAIIDLKENVLRIGDEKAEFLHEKDLPDTLHARIAQGVQSGESSGTGLFPTQSNNSNSNTHTTTQTTNNTNIDELMKLGFSREDAERALRETGGNMELAASRLLQF